MIASTANALYGAKSNVVQATGKNFKDEVLKFPGIVMVEFYAPWCGHCKSLAPEYEKAAGLLNGVVKVVAVDTTESDSEKLAGQYQVQGFPTLKIFGADKKAPTDYQGQRTADAIVSELMKSANNLVKDRKSGGSKKAEGGSKRQEEKKSSGGGSGKSEVIELTSDNFDEQVLQSSDQWLVEFFAPWCGHCKALAPEWDKASAKLKGSVKLGAVDATVHADLAQKYGVKGYPTIKVFTAGKKSGKAKDYQGGRTADDIVEYALKALDEADVPVSISQITDSATFDKACGQTGRVCAVMFVPHILDSSASERNKYVATLTEVAGSFKGKPINFLWSEGMAQEGLEKAVDVSLNYPTLSFLSSEKKVYATMKLSWSLKNIKEFINGVFAGPKVVKTYPMAGDFKISKISGWDGKDGQLPTEYL